MSATPISQYTQNITPVEAASLTQRPQNRVWQFATVFVAAATVAILVLYLLSALSWKSQTFLGFTMSHTMVVNAAVSTKDTMWTGHAAGIQQNDQIVAINGELLASLHTDYAMMQETYNRIIADLAPGESVTIDFIRLTELGAADVPYCEDMNDGSASCQVTYSLIAFPDTDFLAFFIVPFIASIFTFIIGLAVLSMNPNQTESQVVAIIAFLSAIFTAGLFDVGDTNIITPIWIMAAVWLGGSLVTVGMIFPLKLRMMHTYPFLRYLPILIATLAGIIIVQRYLNPTTPWDYNFAVQLATYVLIAGFIGLALLILIAHRPSATTTLTRDQSNTILIGIGLMVLPTTLWLLNRVLEGTGQSALPINFESLMAIIIFPIGALAYAVLQYRQFDSDQVISQSITYTIMLIALIIGYFLLVLGASLFTQGTLSTENADNPFLIAIMIFAMSVLFIPVRTRLQGRVDKLYFRARQNYQSRVEVFTQKLTTLGTFDEIIGEFEGLVKETLAPQATFVYLADENDDYVAFGKSTDVRFSQDSGVVRLLQQNEQAIVLQSGIPWHEELWTDRARLTILNANVVAALPGTDRLNGFIILAPPRSAKQYGFEQIRFINNLISQLSIATERAQVIASLEKRVQELNVLSQVGQAVNFTIEFDDLLELINAQSSRLIDAPCFYIALYDDTSEQLYFAFFLEDDERYSEKENKRWSLGNDLFSQVVKTGRSIRLNDYGRELDKRGISPLFETPQLTAWMAMPLEAGRKTLGVIAAGKMTPGDIYNDEQMNIFENISALAATSIEKARLFTETKVRERQLTVLNDISRQLVATESDVEKLLEIIMGSAVEILNAEAGSLLLTADDNAEDLIFRVVIGGAAETLTGTRWKADEGIVGQVVRTGEAIILNDTSQDPRHAQGASPEFHTSSLLAVPLIAKDNVIGVLEILNKKDKTLFTETDAGLLTTFAGQAAVAIENARMFQMTDIQLSQRVRELEILERIDSELNRTLDLQEVGNITIRAAVANCHAEAGALGIVTGAPPYLRIIAIQGYDTSEYPSTADGMNWPLDRGIVKRVMRSRQADLASDTSIDPDYEQSLRGSLSQITVPMLSGDEINAVLILETNNEPPFNLSDWAFAQRLAEHASIAIANAQLYDALTNANKTKSEFMGFAAHELKTPLTSIIGYADFLRKGVVSDGEQQQNMMNIIHSNAERMKTLINDLRDSAKLDANEFSVELEPTDIRHTIINTLQPFMHSFEEKDQNLINNVQENLPLVLGDQNRLLQVLTNLVSNAHKYSPEGTTITISSEIQENYIDKRGKRRGKMMLISIQDEGIGMSEEDKSRLFKERYFRAGNVGDIKGTGLGMMLTGGIIEKHNGEIWVESELGKGSTFRIAIPLAATEEVIIKEQAPQTEPASD